MEGLAGDRIEDRTAEFKGCRFAAAQNDCAALADVVARPSHAGIEERHPPLCQMCGYVLNHGWAACGRIDDNRPWAQRWLDSLHHRFDNRGVRQREQDPIAALGCVDGFEFLYECTRLEICGIRVPPENFVSCSMETLCEGTSEKTQPDDSYRACSHLHKFNWQLGDPENFWSKEVKNTGDEPPRNSIFRSSVVARQERASGETLEGRWRMVFLWYAQSQIRLRGHDPRWERDYCHCREFQLGAERSIQRGECRMPCCRTDGRAEQTARRIPITHVGQFGKPSDDAGVDGRIAKRLRIRRFSALTVSAGSVTLLNVLLDGKASFESAALSCL
jgi:hypothetical protein